jgi:hypothetical protein
VHKATEDINKAPALGPNVVFSLTVRQKFIIKPEMIRSGLLGAQLRPTYRKDNLVVLLAKGLQKS